jgi:hypothetical protein
VMDEKTLKEIEGCVAESYARAQNGSGPITVAETHRAALVAEVRRLQNIRAETLAEVASMLDGEAEAGVSDEDNGKSWRRAAKFFASRIREGWLK